MSPGLVPTKMFAVVQACVLPHIAVLEKNVSSIWFRQSGNDLKCLFSNSQHSPHFCLYLFSENYQFSTSYNIVQKASFLCVCGRAVSHIAVDWAVVYVLCHFSSVGFLARKILHIPHSWLWQSTLNTWSLSQSKYLWLSACLSLSPPFFPLLLFSFPSSLLFHSLLPAHFFNPFFPLCLPFFLNSCIFFSLQENVSI